MKIGVRGRAVCGQTSRPDVSNSGFSRIGPWTARARAGTRSAPAADAITDATRENIPARSRALARSPAGPTAVWVRILRGARAACLPTQFCACLHVACASTIKRVRHRLVKTVLMRVPFARGAAAWWVVPGRDVSVSLAALTTLEPRRRRAPGPGGARGTPHGSRHRRRAGAGAAARGAGGRTSSVESATSVLTRLETSVRAAVPSPGRPRARRPRGRRRGRLHPRRGARSSARDRTTMIHDGFLNESRIWTASLSTAHVPRPARFAHSLTENVHDTSTPHVSHDPRSTMTTSIGACARVSMLMPDPRPSPLECTTSTGDDRNRLTRNGHARSCSKMVPRARTNGRRGHAPSIWRQSGGR